MYLVISSKESFDCEMSVILMLHAALSCYPDKGKRPMFMISLGSLLHSSLPCGELPQSQLFSPQRISLHDPIWLNQFFYVHILE